MGIVRTALETKNSVTENFYIKNCFATNEISDTNDANYESLNLIGRHFTLDFTARFT